MICRICHFQQLGQIKTPPKWFVTNYLSFKQNVVNTHIFCGNIVAMLGLIVLNKCCTVRLKKIHFSTEEKKYAHKHGN